MTTAEDGEGWAAEQMAPLLKHYNHTYQPKTLPSVFKKNVLEE